MKPGTFASLIVFCLFMGLAAAQNQPPQNRGTQDRVHKEAGVSAGGNWLEFDNDDPMTQAKHVRFELEADNFLRNSGYYKPKIQILCQDKGDFKVAQFDPSVRIAPPNRPGFWGQPQLEVRVRADDKHSDHGWNWINGTVLSMDKGTVRELARAKVFKIQFRSSNGTEIANFSPAGVNMDRLRDACGITN